LRSRGKGALSTSLDVRLRRGIGFSYERPYETRSAISGEILAIRWGNFGRTLVISPTGATLRPDEGAAGMPKGNREAKKPKKEKPKTTAAAASVKGTGSATKK
jgi:hypothetical protein